MHFDICSGALVVFLRLPLVGTVKTRIAEVLGPEEALRIYNLLATQTLETAVSLTLPVYLFYDGGLPDDRIPSFKYQIQVQGDLGQKMMHALFYVLQFHPKAVIIGSDCPSITPELIMEAVLKLEEVDIVIGPAEDGGYYLIGCKKIIPSLFRSIRWSTESVLKQTIEIIQLENLSLHTLPALRDIDTAEDWKNYHETRS